MSYLNVKGLRMPPYIYSLIGRYSAVIRCNEAGEGIYIRKATFGDYTGATRNCGAEISNTKTAKALCDGRKTCVLRAIPSVWGTPSGDSCASKEYQQLYVDYICSKHVRKYSLFFTMNPV